jgi:hypothetical protein
MQKAEHHEKGFDMTLPDIKDMDYHDQQICKVIDKVANTVCDTDVLLEIIGALDILLHCRRPTITGED